MEYGRYIITIIRKSTLSDENVIIADYKSLKFIDILNGVGTWSLSSVTVERCPFTDGDFIRVTRNGIDIFAGVFLQLKEEYVPKKKAWEWTASGKGMNQLLAWKMVFPPMDNNIQYFASREFTMNERIPLEITTLIQNNACTIGSGDYHRKISGFHVVWDAYEIAPYTSAEAVPLVMRFDNLLTAVTDLANRLDLVILPAWIKHSGMEKIVYCVTLGNDLSDTVIFNSATDQINSFRHSYFCPDVTDVIMNFNSDETAGGTEYGTPIWKTMGYSVIPGTEKWREYTQYRETVIKPRKEDFEDTFTSAKIQALADAYTGSQTTVTDSFEVEVNTKIAPYIYGYTWKNDDYQEFKTDYRLGDTIGFVVNDEKFTGRVMKMEFESSYGGERIQPTIGGITKGSFAGILSNLDNLNKSTMKTDTTEVS